MAVDYAAAPATRETHGRPRRYAMISNEVRRDLQAPLGWFERLEVFHFYRVAPWNDMKPEDFANRQLIRFVLPFDLFFKLWRARPEIVQGPEPFSILMLPYLFLTLIYLWLNPRVKLVTLSLEPIPLGKKYHPAIVPIYRLILSWWWRRAAMIIWFDSGSQRNLLANGAPPEKLVNIIYGSWGIEADEFTPEGPAVEVAADEPVVLYVGRLSPVKGVTYLLDAMALLRARGVCAHLAVVGDGAERSALEAQAARLGIAGHMTWYGTIKNADLPPYMRAASMLVLPSITTKLWVQQLSITAWQAMGCGLPVVTTQTGCMGEFTPPEAGVLVPERDALALADAIGALLADKQRREGMARAARTYALRRFDARRNIRVAEQTILEWCR